MNLFNLMYYYIYNIHHNNGYHDIKENTFSKRIIGKHFITTCINYDYFEPKQESIDFVMNKIKKYTQTIQH
jgi:hypothetical protein